MAGVVDLEDLVEDLKAELTVPGASVYANSTTTQWVNQLRNAFWETYLDKITTGYDESDGIITPKTGNTPMPRELQQVILFYASVKVVKNQLLTLRTNFRAKAGAAEAEFQQSAQLLVTLYKSLVEKRDNWIQYLGSTGLVPSYYIDVVQARNFNDHNMYMGSFDGMY